MGRRLFEYEAENTKLLKESHASLQQINDLTDQLHKDRDTIMRLTEDLSKYESAAETAKKIMNDTLAIAEECRRRQDVAEEELKVAKVKAEEDKNTAAQAAYDACFDSLTEDYTAQAKAAFDDAYRQSWRKALRAAGIPSDSPLFGEEGIQWPEDHEPNPPEDDSAEETVPEQTKTVAETVNVEDGQKEATIEIPAEVSKAEVGQSVITSAAESAESLVSDPPASDKADI